MFETDFGFSDGGGANVGNGERTTRIPRADLNGPGQWASHLPMRATGPNASSCSSCHFQPVADGAGDTASDVHRDPFHLGDVGKMIHRNTPHLHGMGAVQRVAEEMTEDLHAQRNAAISLLSSNRRGGLVTVELESKGVSFGRIFVRSAPRATRGPKPKKTQNRPESSESQRLSMARPMRHQEAGSLKPTSVQIDYSQLEGIDEDLVVKPFQWKGTFPTVRSFNLDAMHNELGVQPREILPDEVDGDGDGYYGETTIGDMTALAIYLAAQPRPTTKVELGEFGLAPEVSPDDIAEIQFGRKTFDSIGCASCHVPELTINVPIFSEPSTN